MFLKNRFFDKTELETNPIKEYITYTYDNLIPEMGQGKTFEIKENKVES